MKRVDKYSFNKGFTLLELLIVLAILIVIIGMLATTVWTQYKKALVRITTNQIKTVQNAVEQFKIDIGRYPTQQEGLYILVGKDNPEATQTPANPVGSDPNGMNMNSMNPSGMNPGGMGGTTGMTGMDGGMGGMTGMGGMDGGMGGMTGMTGMDGGMGGMTNQQMNPVATAQPRKPKITEPFIERLPPLYFILTLLTLPESEIISG